MTQVNERIFSTSTIAVTGAHEEKNECTCDHRLDRLVARCVFEPAHFIMEQKMMRGIKVRAEQAAVEAPAPTAAPT